MEGISFIVRVRNEQATLEQSLRSLKPLTIPHEIIVILHMCTDGSEAIARRLQSEGLPIQIHKYGTPVSRAGFETLVTDASSFHSMVYYSKWCFSRTDTFAWKFRWDADFIAPPSLIEYLNHVSWGPMPRPMRIHFMTDPVNRIGEYYLSTGPFVFKKFLFWEFYEIDGPRDEINAPEHVSIQHASTIEHKKSYWDEPSWFLTDDSSEARYVLDKYRKLTSICGAEVIGHARCANPVSADIERTVYAFQPVLESCGIRFWS